VPAQFLSPAPQPPRDPRASREPLSLAQPARDPLELVALVAHTRRAVLLRAYRKWLRHEDLEDCFSQSTFELLRRAHAGTTWRSTGHLANHLDQRFVSRVQDRLRAVNGRSPRQTAAEEQLRCGCLHDAPQPPGAQLALEELVMLRMQLRELPQLARALTPDQRLVLATQVALQMPCADFCASYGWSREKYRKVAQRARAKLRALSEAQADAVGGGGQLPGSIASSGIRP
jgi:DNA-directed RNA polymerase specialized sigma24 family protein